MVPWGRHQNTLTERWEAPKSGQSREVGKWGAGAMGLAPQSRICQGNKALTYIFFLSPTVSVSLCLSPLLPVCSLLLCTSVFSLFLFILSLHLSLLFVCLVVSSCLSLPSLILMCLISLLTFLSFAFSLFSPCLLLHPSTYHCFYLEFSPLLPVAPSLCLPLPLFPIPVYFRSSSSLQRTLAALERDSTMQMTGWLGQQLWSPRPGLLALLEGMVLGAKEEVSLSATAKTGAGLAGRLSVFTPNPSSFSSSQPWPCSDLDNWGGVPWHQKRSWPIPSSPVCWVWGGVGGGCREGREGTFWVNGWGPKSRFPLVGWVGGGCSLYLFFHLVSGEEGLGVFI